MVVPSSTLAGSNVVGSDSSGRRRTLPAGGAFALCLWPQPGTRARAAAVRAKGSKRRGVKGRFLLSKSWKMAYYTTQAKPLPGQAPVNFPAAGAFPLFAIGDNGELTGRFSEAKRHGVFTAAWTKRVCGMRGVPASAPGGDDGCAAADERSVGASSWGEERPTPGPLRGIAGEPIPVRVETKTMRVAGRRVRCRVLPPAPSGPAATPLGCPLVLIHGLGCSSTIWGRAIRRLARCGLPCGVIAPDLPGYGRSEGPEEALSVDALADWTAELLDTLGIARAHVAGNSLGCQVALALARRHPDRVGALVLVGPTLGGGIVPAWRYVLGVLADGAREPVLYNGTLLRMYLQMGLRRFAATVPLLFADDTLGRGTGGPRTVPRPAGRRGSHRPGRFGPAAGGHPARRRLRQGRRLRPCGAVQPPGQLRPDRPGLPPGHGEAP